MKNKPYINLDGIRVNEPQDHSGETAGIYRITRQLPALSYTRFESYCPAGHRREFRGTEVRRIQNGKEKCPACRECKAAQP